ncbi:hypothetical protein BWQ96_05462 [Gracilariopsis chorda]|uniref:Uncharacterized protein n=1 Tax=Gracilariopsis chorda TaxID=448386 RepID=A0A2V3IRP2_9FLOR|nr:hypothetical protein BWQ96_05462 [Gracilariopsis chorda]|eukprot:PXF44792.1 hypothetical protein BWQ96_05462 [Gracilariopsis chorda]
MNSVIITLPPPVAEASSRHTSDTSADFTACSLDTLDLEKTGREDNHSVHPETDAEDFKLPAKHPKHKRIFHLPVFSTHRRLIALTVVLNLALLALGASLHWHDNLPAIGYLVISNITIAVLIRQQRIINLLFFLATCTKTRLPLRIRWMLGKIYHFGGLHSACAVSATVWLLLFTISATALRASRAVQSPSEILLFLTYMIDLLLVAIVILALPRFRSKFHNTFEATHRFMGWSALLLVWIHTIFLIRDFKSPDQSMARAFFTSVSPYLLLLITVSIASPWLYLHKVPVTITKPSTHAIIVKFEGVKQTFPGSSSAISIAPLYEWHSFANIPSPGSNGFRLVISRAGDWTSSVIDKPPSHFWVRGIPTAGVANMETLFHKVLYVATGSGIGPVLPHLLAKRVPSRLFWSTRTPEQTYGHELVTEIRNSSPDAVIHDTTALGKPDMVKKAYQLCRESNAEAVIVISNQKLTRKVVYGMEARGIPAFGAIWDS